MTKHEKQIRANWSLFRSKTNKTQKIELKTEDISKVLSGMFG